MTELVDAREEEGVQLELHRRGEAYEVRVGGRTLVASDQRRAEQSLVELALAPLRQRDDITVLVAGLGLGFTVRAVLDAPGVKRVDVVERSQAIIDWGAQHFAALNGDVRKDQRLTVHQAELGEFVRRVRLGGVPNVPADGWLAIVLDVDHGPSAPLWPRNQTYYEDAGVELLEGVLRPGGVLALWSTQRETEMYRRLHARLQNVAEVAVPVEVAGSTTLDYVYRGRRPAPVDPSKPAN